MENHHRFFFLLSWLKPPQWARTTSLSRLYDHTQTHHTRYDISGRVISSSQIPVPDNTQHSQRQTSTPSTGFEPVILAIEWPQTPRHRQRDHGDRLIAEKYRIYSAGYGEVFVLTVLCGQLYFNYKRAVNILTLYSSDYQFVYPPQVNMPKCDAKIKYFLVSRF